MVPIVLEIVKLLVEQYTPPQVPELIEATSEVTIIIPAYNEEKAIARTLDSAAKLGYAIIVVVNGATDDTAKVARSHPSKPIVIEMAEGNKTKATELGLTLAETPYVLVIDADTELPEKKLRYDPSHNVLMAFPVVPLETKTLIQKLQDIEYRRSMYIGKTFSAKDTFMASGACVMGHAPDLKAIPHSGVFAGEDTERSLCWHRRGGRVVFDKDREFKTDVPATLRELINQRRQKWNPGGYRLLPLALSVLLRNKVSWRLRLQIMYTILAYTTDPIRIASLLTFYWLYPAVYFIYVICAALTIARVGKHYTLFWKIALCSLYPLYMGFLMLLRLSTLTNKKVYKTTRHKFASELML